ncbi:MAG: 5-oxoprolinase/urea amidolyase family protein, partial [Microbacterium sp.]
PAARTLLVRLDTAVVTAAALTSALEAIPLDAVSGLDGQTVVIPVTYDGEDLADVAALLGLSEDEVIARHTAAHWRVAFCGFAPGFGYLVCDDPVFDVPRRSTSRTRVPAGAVGLAGEFSGVYPRSSPGGWQLIGRTAEPMWDLHREPPSRLAPGDHVRFERAEREPLVVSAPPAPALRSVFAVEVVSPGPQLVIEDGGRPGHAALGVGASGAADRVALHEANRAVGNAPDDAVLEVAGGGAALRFRGAGVIALAGAETDAVCAHADEEHPVAPGMPFAVFDGDELRLGTARTGLRAVLAIRGGMTREPALGSRSCDTLSGVGGEPLRTGDVIPLRGPGATGLAVEAVSTRPLPEPGELVELRVTLGPRDDWFAAVGVHTLLTQEWLVTSQSDRVGVRLQGETPLERAHWGELPSEAVVTGAIQVPADGQPVLFGPDHPLTGGYPVIAAVATDDLSLAFQLPPGARIRFVLDVPVA